ncbi:MAG: bifunctional folylpolyglutamate synthase/dihydrofolate synthase [Bryobacterales bacterium]|nr:bifunctional folylpolyglutamate synthase/dihydrofolate synthase [Bryobacterales bacterium]
MTYAQSVGYLLSLLGSMRHSDFGLHRMEALCAEMGHPERAFRVVHVAGTNGKGSTGAMIESGLRQAGFRTGFYSSPHLSSFNERFRLQGVPADNELFAEAVDRTQRAVERLVARGGREAHPTMFEIVTAASFEAFRSARVDYGVIEVGLGGRLDATNVVEPEVAVITPIGLDHEAFLGKGLAAIAGEKAGIFKQGCSAVSSSQAPAAAQALRARAQELGVRLTFAPERWTLNRVEPDERGRFRFLASAHGTSVEVSVALAGEHQVENALTALCALDRLGVGLEHVSRGIASVEWPGRLEWFEGRPPVLLDAAHNPAGAKTLARYLERFHSDRDIHLIYGSSRDKAVEEVAALLFPQARRVTLTQSQVARSVSPAALEALVDHLHDRIDHADTVLAALERARSEAHPSTLIVIAGSIFLIGEIREQILAN